MGSWGGSVRRHHKYPYRHTVPMGACARRSGGCPQEATGDIGCCGCSNGSVAIRCSALCAAGFPTTGQAVLPTRWPPARSPAGYACVGRYSVAVARTLHALTVAVALTIAPPAFVVPAAGPRPNPLAVGGPIAPLAFVALLGAFVAHREHTLTVTLAVAKLAFVADSFSVGAGPQALIRQDASTVGNPAAPLAFVVGPVGESASVVGLTAKSVSVAAARRQDALAVVIPLAPLAFVVPAVAPLAFVALSARKRVDTLPTALAITAHARAGLGWRTIFPNNPAVPPLSWSAVPALASIVTTAPASTCHRILSRIDPLPLKCRRRTNRQLPYGGARPPPSWASASRWPARPDPARRVHRRALAGFGQGSPGRHVIRPPVGVVYMPPSNVP